MRIKREEVGFFSVGDEPKASMTKIPADTLFEISQEGEVKRGLNPCPRGI
jgi:hypothetical protein